MEKGQWPKCLNAILFFCVLSSLYMVNYLEHDLDELLLVLFSEFPQDEHAEVLEVDNSLLLHLVCHVD